MASIILQSSSSQHSQSQSRPVQIELNSITASWAQFYSSLCTGCAVGSCIESSASKSSPMLSCRLLISSSYDFHSSTILIAALSFASFVWGLLHWGKKWRSNITRRDEQQYKRIFSKFRWHFDQYNYYESFCVSVHLGMHCPCTHDVLWLRDITKSLYKKLESIHNFKSKSLYCICGLPIINEWPLWFA